MRKLMLLGSAAVLMLAPHAFAQDAATTQTRAGAANEVTLIGCLMREVDYRKMNSGGRGGVLGTGVGAGNEFVLVDASPLTQDEAKRRTAARAAKQKMPPAAVGTSGTAGKAYNLTGESEKNLVTDIGRLIEVVGTVDNSNAQMPNVTISVWHPVGDYCPATK